MDVPSPQAASYVLPPEIAEYRDLARRIVREELLPLEREFLASPRQAYGLPPIVNLTSVFDRKVVDRLIGVARESGLWYLMVPEQYGGSSLGMLAQCVILEEFNYTAVPFPFGALSRAVFASARAVVTLWIAAVASFLACSMFALASAAALSALTLRSFTSSSVFL